MDKISESSAPRKSGNDKRIVRIGLKNIWMYGCMEVELRRWGMRL